jgi:hypothetical protein
MQLGMVFKRVVVTAFVESSVIGRTNDPLTRLSNAAILVMMWLVAFCFSTVCVISHWIVDLWPLYWRLWPFQDADPKIAMAGVFVFFGIPVFLIVFNIRMKLESSAKKKVSLVNVLIIAIIQPLLVISVPFNKYRYAALGILAFHLALACFFYWRSFKLPVFDTAHQALPEQLDPHK